MTEQTSKRKVEPAYWWITASEGRTMLANRRSGLWLQLQDLIPIDRLFLVRYEEGDPRNIGEVVESQLPGIKENGLKANAFIALEIDKDKSDHYYLVQFYHLNTASSYYAKQRKGIVPQEAYDLSTKIRKKQVGR